MITQEKLNALFRYDNGFLYWRKNNKIAGWYDNGYTRVSIESKQYLLHRIVFMMFHGYMPEFIDHIDEDRSNNRIANLRAATKSQNNSNVTRNILSFSGVKGVDWHKPLNKWRVRVAVNNKSISVGYFDDLDLAELVAIEARNKYHGDFANHK